MGNRKFLSMLLIGCIVIAVGAVIMNFSGAVIRVVLVLAGIAALLDGLDTLRNMKKWNFQDLTRTLSTIKGAESALIGLGAIIVGLFFNAALTVMIYIFAAGLVFSAIVSFQNALTAKDFGAEEVRSRFISEGVISLLIAIILFFKPLETLYTLFRIVGIVVIVAGALIVAYAVLGKIKASKAKEEKESMVGEAEVVDEEKD